MKNTLRKIYLNTKYTSVFIFGLTCLILLSLIQFRAETYIAARYTVPEIVNESSNILIGTISEVNTNRKNAKVKVTEYLKGSAEFQEVKIRFDVYKGEEDQREQLSQFLKVGEPIIVFYLKKNNRIDSLAHTRGKWFQTQVTRQNGKWGWWGFTHFEKYLNKDKVSKRDSTPEFQNELTAMLGENAVQLHFLNTDDHKEEIRTITEINQVSDRWIAYKSTENKDLPGISNADILWLGHRSIGRDGKYRLNTRQESKIKEFVKNGGIVIVSGQDSDPKNPCKTGWLPQPLNGVESNHRNDFKITSNAGSLFNQPHRIRTGQLSLDDSWDGWNNKFEILATTNGGKEIVVAKLKYGKGMYLITSLHNNRKEQIAKNRPMLENIVHFAVNSLEKSQ